MSSEELLLIIIKPDGIQNGLKKSTINTFEKSGFKIIAAKLCIPTISLENYYMEHHSSNLLIDSATDQKYCAMVWAGKGIANQTKK